MNLAHRIVFIMFLLLLTYCCVWIPWCLPAPQGKVIHRLGYGFLWSGPMTPEARPIGDIFDQVTAQQEMRQWSTESARARPDIPIMIRGTSGQRESGTMEQLFIYLGSVVLAFGCKFCAEWKANREAGQADFVYIVRPKRD